MPLPDRPETAASQEPPDAAFFDLMARAFTPAFAASTTTLLSCNDGGTWELVESPQRATAVPMKPLVPPGATATPHPGLAKHHAAPGGDDVGDCVLRAVLLLLWSWP